MTLLNDLFFLSFQEILFITISRPQVSTILLLLKRDNDKKCFFEPYVQFLTVIV